MRKTKVKELSLETFSMYGTFAKMIEPDGVSVGPKIHEFFCDRILYASSSTSPAGLSISHVQRREVVVDTTEIHKMCGEILLPLDGDVYIHVGKVSDPEEPDYDSFEIFRIPKGWAVGLKPGVWHFAAFPCKQEWVSVLVVLPERTYAYDCIVKKIPQDKWLVLDDE